MYEQVVPCIYVLMSRKSEAAYTAVFKYITENVMSLACHMFMTDFEIALRNALQSVASDALARCCWFHFTQACKRCARQLEELIPLIKEGKGKNIYHRLLCLPLLPADKIDAAFTELKQKALDLHSTGFIRFLNYYENQWLKRVSFLCNWFYFLVFFRFVKQILFWFKCINEWHCNFLNNSKWIEK